jgi:DNA primase catalytic core
MEISEIKQRLKVEAVLKHYGLQVNRNHMLKCPFHADDKPSLKVYPDTNTFNCFGCDANGDVIEFIQRKENCNKHEALKKATEMFDSNVIPSQVIQAKPRSIDKVERTTILDKIFTQFKTGIKSNLAKKPKAYLSQRNLNQEKLELGYNSGQFHHRGKLSDEDLQAYKDVGLLIEYSGYTPNGNKTTYTAFAKDCIIFPLKDKRGNIVSIYGRSIIDNNKSKHFYLKNRQGLYPNYPSPNTEKIILTEAIIDAATLLQLSKITKQYQVLSLYGTNGLTAEHSEALKEWSSSGVEKKEIIFFFDGDRAGSEAIEKYKEQFAKELPNVVLRKIDTPGGEDISSLHQMYDSQDYFLELLEERQPLSQSDDLFLSIELTANNSIEKKKERKQAAPEPSKAVKLLTDNPEQLIYETSELKITIWGGIEKENLSRLKISMHVKSKTNKYKSFRDDVNLYSHAGTQKLIQNISETLEVSTTTIIKTITELTEELEAYRLEERTAIAKALKPKLYEMSELEKQAAQSFLKTKGLGKRTLELIQQSGLIGEEKNGLLLYFLYTSRLMDEPLHAIIFGKSGSGKTYLQTKVSECLPEESVRTVTSLTENTLYYSAKNFWKHKVLLIEDLEGVYNAFLPLREFMSKQSISKLTTDKDAKGNNVQKLLTVEGPICVSGATTQGSIYEDNANRSFLLHIDESSNHLNQVMEYQRKIQAGIVNETQQQTAKQLLKNSQRLLRKVRVINPYATDLRIPDCVFKKLRTNMHYLKLIEIITFYNQYNRKLEKSQIGEPYIKTAIEDIELANWLVKETLLQKSDELSNDVRYFFESLKEQVKEANTTVFFAKDVRKNFRMHPMKLSRYLSQLVQRNYIKKISNRQSGFEYEILTFDDYQLLKEGINVLDKILENIKAKNEGKTKDLHTSFTSASQI